MRRALPILFLLLPLSFLPWPVRAQQLALQAPSTAPETIMPATIMDVAPTTLDLTADRPGLFYVTNHGTGAVTVQIQAMDWRQEDGRDVLSPSAALLASPPMIRIQPGARQSVRVLARGPAGGERAFRLLVSQLPDAAQDGDGVHVLLQFSVPVFAGHDRHMAPDLKWSVRDGILIAANAANQTAKLEGLAVNGVPRASLAYLLPGASRDFGAVTGPVRVTVHEGRSDRDLSADVRP